MQLSLAEGIGQLGQLSQAGDRSLELDFIKLEACHECRSKTALLGFLTIHPICCNDGF